MILWAVDSVKAPPKPIMVCLLFFVLIETVECCSDFLKIFLLQHVNCHWRRFQKHSCCDVLLVVQLANPMTVIRMNQTDFLIRILLYVKRCFNYASKTSFFSRLISTIPQYSSFGDAIIRYARTVRVPSRLHLVYSDYLLSTNHQ